MTPPADSTESGGAIRPADERYAAAYRVVSDRDRLDASEAAVASEVVHRQLTRQRSDLVVPEQVEPLSPREEEVLALVAGGRSDGEIAAALFISKKTASVHVANIKGKLGADSRIEIALIAGKLGWLSDSPVAAGSGPPSFEPGGSPPRPNTVCPFKGLASYEAPDARYFFGRERLIADMIARLAGSTFLGVVGPSGSGKSSAVRAGLVPALADGALPGSGEWVTILFRPGATPAARLRQAIQDGSAGSDTRRLVVVDQLEEIFTLCRDAAERSAFVDDLVALARDVDRRAQVVVAIRADFYGRCAEFPGLADLLGRSHLLVGPMTAEELARAIDSPAKAAGLRVDPALVGALVDDVEGQPGGLPMLSATLVDLWRLREGRRLRLEAYERIGGVRGAVARLAEASFTRLTPPQRDVARSLLLRLATSGDDGVAVRRPAELAEFEVHLDPDRDAALAVLTEDRVLTVDRGSVEIAHEALLRHWPRLADWLESDRDGRRIREHLAREASAWAEGGEDDGDLMRAARLAATLDWAAVHEAELTARERRYLDASREAGQRELRRERRTNRRLRGLLAGTGLFLAVALAAGGVAIGQAQRADSQRDLAVAEAHRAEAEAAAAREAETAARAHELTAEAIAALDHDPQLALLLALEAVRTGNKPSDEAITTLHAAVQQSRTIFHTVLDAPIAPLSVGVALSPDGSTVYVSTDSHAVQVFDVASGSLIRTLGEARTDTEPNFLSVVLTPDGRHLAWVDEGAVIHLWDTRTWAERTIQAPGFWTDWPAFSADGRYLATITLKPQFDRRQEGRFVSVWDVATGQQIRVWELTSVYAVSFHPDGQKVLATDCPCNPDAAVTLLDIDSGEIRSAVTDVEGIIASGPTSAAFSPDGSTLATAGEDGKINLWDAASGAHLQRFQGHTERASFVLFSRDGSRLASTGQDGVTRVWDVRSGDELLALRGQGGAPLFASFSADGGRLATASSDLSVRVWDLAPQRIAEVAAHAIGYADAFDIEARGDMIAAIAYDCNDCDGFAVAIDLANGRRTSVPMYGGAIALSPEGDSVVVQEALPAPAERPTARPSFIGERPGAGSLRTFRLPAGTAVATFDGLCPYHDNTPILGGEPACAYPPTIPWDETARSLNLSSDGSLLVMTGFSRALAVWDVATNQLVAGPKVFERGIDGGVISPDRSVIAVASPDYGVTIVDASTLSEVKVLPFTNALPELEFSPDGTLLAVPSRDGNARIYTVATWSYASLPVVSHDLQFTGDGSRLVTMDTDGYVREWDVTTLTMLQAVPTGPTGGTPRVVLAFALVDDGRRFVVAHQGTLLVMTLDVDELVQIAEARAVRGPTAEECVEFELRDCEGVAPAAPGAP